jgi:hypothetical protein
MRASSVSERVAIAALAGVLASWGGGSGCRLATSPREARREAAPRVRRLLVLAPDLKIKRIADLSKGEWAAPVSTDPRTSVRYAFPTALVHHGYDVVGYIAGSGHLIRPDGARGPRMTDRAGLATLVRSIEDGTPVSADLCDRAARLSGADALALLRGSASYPAPGVRGAEITASIFLAILTLGRGTGTAPHTTTKIELTLTIVALPGGEETWSDRLKSEADIREPRELGPLLAKLIERSPPAGPAPRVRTHCILGADGDGACVFVNAGAEPTSECVRLRLVAKAPTKSREDWLCSGILEARGRSEVTFAVPGMDEACPPPWTESCTIVKEPVALVPAERGL